MFVVMNLITSHEVLGLDFQQLTFSWYHFFEMNAKMLP